ncbi:MAG: dual specificity protein phosphatase family protein [Desulfobacterales bacterium]
MRETDRYNIMKELRFGFIGDYPVAGMGEPWASKIAGTHRLLRQAGIGAILCLTEEDLYGRRHVSAGFRYGHIPVEDTRPPALEAMEQAVSFIDHCLENGTGVAVHCLEGRGRTGTVLCGWLGMRESLNAANAVTRIRRLRPETVLTPTQKDFLVQFLDRNST